jgi:hypothetical protein
MMSACLRLAQRKVMQVPVVDVAFGANVAVVQVICETERDAHGELLGEVGSHRNSSGLTNRM